MDVITISLLLKAITAVGKVLAPYDSDDSYPVIGFGARLPIPDGKFTEVQHCFPVSTSGMAVKGISGILSVRLCFLLHSIFSHLLLLTLQRVGI